MEMKLEHEIFYGESEDEVAEQVNRFSPVVVSVDSFDSENINHEELIEQFTDKLDK